MRPWPMVMMACLSIAACGPGEAPADEAAQPRAMERTPELPERGADGFRSGRRESTARADADADAATGEACHPSYPDFCVPPPPPDMKCAEVTGKKPFTVRHDVARPDPHGFDRDRDGKACEPRPRRRGGK